jgi:N-acyl amino acid synthase of PEP-CTERM/exosortase system
MAMHKLRYKVYCVENAFENPAEHPNGLEGDGFDSHASHALLIHRATNVAVGTVRLILPVPSQLDSSFAMQSICSPATLADIPLETTAEVSRFCIEKSFRHLLYEHANYGTHQDPAEPGPPAGDVRRIVPSITLGLVQWLVAASHARGITHWLAVMEPQLIRLLARLGIHFDPIGALVNYHGWRQPCAVEVNRMLGQVRRQRPDVWSIIGQKQLVLDHA